jgi:hypothetical protein
MHAQGACRLLALAVAFGLSAAGVHAELITPDSIPNPPPAVGSGNLTPIPSFNNLVTTQYSAMGLNFSSFTPPLTASVTSSLTAITKLNGVNVWAPAAPLLLPMSRIAGGPPPNFPVAQISYNGAWSGAQLIPSGSPNPKLTSSVTLEIIGRPVTVNFFGAAGQLLGSVTGSGVGTHGGELYSFTGYGISSFQVSAPEIHPPPGAMAINPAWGVAEVSVTPSHAPEPSSLVLAGIGGLGFVLRRRWRNALA